MNAEQRILSILLGPILVVTVAACAVIDENHEDHWRTLTVKDIVHRTELPDDVDLRCVNDRAATDNERIAIVQYRAGRSSYRHAFVLRSDDPVKVGDRVAVNPRLCAVRGSRLT